MCNPQTALFGFSLARSAMNANQKSRQGRYQAKSEQLNDQKAYQQSLKSIRAAQGSQRAAAARLGLGQASSVYDQVNAEAFSARQEESQTLRSRDLARRIALRQQQRNARNSFAFDLISGLGERLLGQ